MNTAPQLRPRTLLLFAAGSLLAAIPTHALPPVFDLTVTGEVYHAQVTDHYCASATIEMMLDCTAVRSTNAYINTFLNAPDPLNIPQSANGQHTDDIPPQPIYNAGQVLFAPQVAIYNLIHGHATYTPIAGPNTGIPLTYSNPFWPWPSTGSGTNAVQWALNVLDNPTVGGNGNHSYTGFNVASGAFASRTIANAIKDYDVPAQVTIGNGAHSIAVTGVTGIGVAARNTNYTITGFYVNDPWTGYAISQGLPAAQRGLGEHTWVRYGFRNTNGPAQINVPGIGLVNAAPNTWFRYFNPAPPQPGEGAYLSGVGYKFVVERSGRRLSMTAMAGSSTATVRPMRCCRLRSLRARWGRKPSPISRRAICLMSTVFPAARSILRTPC